MFPQAIKGLELGVRSMCRGERALLECRADYAYGEVGAPEKGIPPNATLIFDVRVVRLNSYLL
jgi:FK506-binding protein 4/5